MKAGFAFLLPLAFLGLTSTQVPWEDLTESDWLFSLATRFSIVEGHQAHYPTPTAELARLLEGRQETAALRALADARMALGDRPGALAALTRWAEGTGPEAWAETMSKLDEENFFAFQPNESAPSLEAPGTEVPPPPSAAIPPGPAP